MDGPRKHTRSQGGGGGEGARGVVAGVAGAGPGGNNLYTRGHGGRRGALALCPGKVITLSKGGIRGLI